MFPVSTTGRRALLAALALVVAGAAVGPAVGALPAAGDRPVAGPGSVPAVAAGQETPANRTPVRHEDPAAVSEAGDLAAVERWLAARLAERLAGSSVALSRGEYGVARRLVGDEYRRLLGQYVEVADETPDDADDRTAEEFRRAGETQDRLVGAVGAYNDTYREYRAARRRGNETRARMLARQLERRASRINRTGGTLLTRYDEGGDADDVTIPPATVRNVTATVEARQERVREETFVETRLAVALEPAAVSFLRPGTVVGRLVDENGTPVADRRIRLQVGARTLAVETNGTGWFTGSYRPTLLPVNASSVVVRYLPQNVSIYAGSRASVPVTVRQVGPTVTVAVRPSRAGFGEDVRVTGVVTAGDVGAAGVPVVVSIGDRRGGGAVTGADGRFALTVRFPATLDAGMQTVRARFTLGGRALATASGETTVRITPTPTSLGLSAVRIDDRTVRVDGTLTTVDGVAVGDRPVRIDVAGTPVTSVRTDADGAFRTTVTVPDRAAGDRVRLLAAFAATGSSLEPATAEATVTLSGADGRPGPTNAVEEVLSRLGPVSRWWPALVVALLALAVVLVGVYRRWRLPDALGTGGAAAPDDPDAGAGGFEFVGEQPRPAGRSRSLLASARARLAAGDTDDAVTLAYGVVRGGLGEPAPRGARTHWEFFTAVSADGLDEEAVDALRRLTEAYERAAFAPRSVSRDDAASVLDDANRLAAVAAAGTD